MEISEVRKQVRLAIERSRQEAAQRRARTDAAGADYQRFLESVAGPMFQMVATVLRAEGHAFTVFTPRDGLRLASGRSAEDFIELGLETAGGDPIVVARVSRSRGRNVLSYERPVRELTPPGRLAEADVLEMLLQEIGALVER